MRVQGVGATLARKFYSLESESPKFFAGVDLDTGTRSLSSWDCVVTGQVSSLRQVLPQQAGWCFRWFLVARAVRITEANFFTFVATVKVFVFSHLQPRSQVNDRPAEMLEACEFAGSMRRRPQPCPCFARQAQGSKTRMTFHQGRYVTVLCASGGRLPNDREWRGPRFLQALPRWR